MGKTLVLSQTRVLASDNDLRHLRNEVVSVLRRLDGFEGASGWRSTTDEQVLMVVENRDPETAEEGFRLVGASDIFAKAAQITIDPIDMTRLRVIATRGFVPSDAEVGHFLSLSVRVADPGHGEELDLDLETVFDEIAVIDGFRGAIRATNEVLPEEVFGLAIWASEEAFQKSIPTSHKTDVRLFQRVV